jgi:hypothetical protein
VKKMEGQLEALHVDLEQLTGVLRRLLSPECAVDPAGVKGKEELGKYVS